MSVSEDAVIIFTALHLGTTTVRKRPNFTYCEAQLSCTHRCTNRVSADIKYLLFNHIVMSKHGNSQTEPL